MERQNERRRPGVGVAMVIERAGAILLVRRTHHGGGSWSAPGGYLDPGEDLADAVKREVREETALDVDEASFIAVTNDRFDDGKHNVTVWFSAGRFHGEPAVAAPDELSDIAWFPWDALPQPLYASTRAFLDGETLPPAAVNDLKGGKGR